MKQVVRLTAEIDDGAHALAANQVLQAQFRGLGHANQHSFIHHVITLEMVAAEAEYSAAHQSQDQRPSDHSP